MNQEHNPLDILNQLQSELSQKSIPPLESRKIRNLILSFMSLLQNNLVSEQLPTSKRSPYEIDFLNSIYQKFMHQTDATSRKIVEYVDAILLNHHEGEAALETLLAPSNVLAQFKKHQYGDKFKKHICPNPFKYGELRKNGDIAVCCYVDFPLGNVNENTLEEIWHGEKAQELRRSILTGEYSYCNSQKCGGMQKLDGETGKNPPVYQTPYELFSHQELPYHGLEWILSGNTPKVPQIISLEDDPTCNLSCPSCRKEKIVLGRKEEDRLIANENKVLQYGENIDELWLCGAGDPFVSVPYRKMLKEFDPIKTPNLKFRLDTNGVMLNQNTWDKVVHQAKDNISMIAVSVDATTEDVYNITRRDGNFTKLMENLDFISELPQRQKGMTFIIRMIVQQKNYHQMLDFVALGQRLNVDRIVFSGISNWGTFSQNEYQNHAVQYPSHPEYNNLCEVIKHDVFASDQIDLGNLTSLYNQLQNQQKKSNSDLQIKPQAQISTAISLGGLKISDYQEKVSTTSSLTQETSKSRKRPLSIAFYLPQYHPIPENDKWWGPGFTEWTNTAKATKHFDDHYQPHIPADLGFYDLRLAASRKAQADLAKTYDVDAFCYWHYWFGSGRRLLEQPLDEVIRTGEPNHQFCLGWANQTWSGVWHGAPNRILMEQTYPGLEDYKTHFYTMLKAFQDPRYVKLNGKLLFLIYNPAELPDSIEFTRYWNELAQKENLPGFHFIAHNQREHQKFGCDSSIDNAPFIHFPASQIPVTGKTQNGPKVRSYQQFVDHMKSTTLNQGEHALVIPNWDNTPRSGENGHLLHDSTPELFQEHVKDAVNKLQNRPIQDQVVFIKAWNEWAEGNHMEPDLKYGHAYLQAFKNAINGAL